MAVRKLHPPLETQSVPKKLPTTAVMVDRSLEKLYTAKGVTLQRLRTFIESEYVIQITNQRNVLIKKRLNQLRFARLLKNTTGKGFSGRFKLAKKPTKKFWEDLAAGTQNAQS